MASKTDGTPERGSPPKGWRRTFLKVLGDTANVRAACEKAGVSRTTAYRIRNSDARFARRWDEAIESSVDLLEIEAARRAIKGVEEPVYYKGKVVGTVKRPSDALLMFLLRAHRPAKYRENHKLVKQLEDMLRPEQKFVIPEIDDRPEPDPES